MSVRHCLTGAKRVKRRLLALTMLVSQILPQMNLPARAQTGEPVRFAISGAKSMPERTARDLRQQWDAVSVPDRRYDQAPCVHAPYQPGKLSGEFIRQNLECVNLFRYSAGLPFVSASDVDNRSAQYGAVLLAGANTLDHHPQKPADMEDSFYQTGCEALCAGNIGYLQYAEPAAEQKKCANAIPTLIRNYMNDRGSFNRSCVPHRRWILWPGLQTVGVGCADSGDGTMYQVLKVLGTRGGTASVDYDFVAWPASGAFPTQVLSPGVPWSVTLNPGVFEIPTRDGLTVSVMRRADGKIWELDASTSSCSAQAQFMCLDTRRYGVGNCILFAFDQDDADGYQGEYRVTVCGLRTLDGDAAILDYTVRFVDMEACDHSWTVGTVLEPSGRYHSGRAEFFCTACGARKTDLLPLGTCKENDCPGSRFTDMPAPGSWSHNGVDFVVENGIFSGTCPTTFSPKGCMTRAMMVTVLWRIAGKPDADGGVDFTDVKEGAYYARAVRWAGARGLVKGISADRFCPDALLTRAQAVTMLRRFFAPDGSAGTHALDVFADGAAVGKYARESFAWAVEHRVITGQPGADGTVLLLPDQYITREQAAAILMRCMTEL